MVNFETPIPINMDEGTGILGGTFKTRNAFEALIGGILVFFLFRWILSFIKRKLCLIISASVAAICALFLLIGVNGKSLTEFIGIYLKFRFGRSIATLGMPDKGEDADKNEKKTR